MEEYTDNQLWQLIQEQTKAEKEAFDVSSGWQKMLSKTSYTVFVFDRQFFNEMIPQIEDTFNVKIQCNNTTLQSIRLNHTFKVATLNEFLTSLQTVVDFVYTEKGTNVIIH